MVITALNICSGTHHKSQWQGRYTRQPLLLMVDNKVFIPLFHGGGSICSMRGLFLHLYCTLRFFLYETFIKSDNKTTGKIPGILFTNSDCVSSYYGSTGVWNDKLNGIFEMMCRTGFRAGNEWRGMATDANPSFNAYVIYAAAARASRFTPNNMVRFHVYMPNYI